MEKAGEERNTGVWVKGKGFRWWVMGEEKRDFKKEEKQKCKIKIKKEE